MSDPALLILDEPTTSLDAQGATAVADAVRACGRNRAMLVITHHAKSLELADEIVVMNNAVIEQAGPAREVFNAPKTKFVAQFMGGHNVIVLPEGSVAVRTDAVSTTTVESGRVEARVLSVEYQGTHVSILTKIAGDQEVTALIPDTDFFEKPHNPGDQIGLVWAPNNQHQLTA